ncbi:AAA domain-containing protein, partial [Chloroflexota bacterium]
MEINEIKAGELTEIVLRPLEDGVFDGHLHPGKAVKLFWRSDWEQAILSVDDENWEVWGDSASQHDLLLEIVSKDLPRVCWIDAVLPNTSTVKKIILSVRSFSAKYILAKEEEINFLVSDHLFDSLLKRFIKQNKANQDVLDWLVENTIIQNNGDTAVLISAGTETRFDDLRNSNFRVYGRRIALDVEKRENGYWIRRVVNYRGSTRQQVYLQIFGQFRYIDVSAAKQYEQSGITELDHIVSQNAGSYLKIWNQYNRLERAIIIEKARDFGWFRYELQAQTPIGWRLKIINEHQNRLEQLDLYEELTLEVAEKLPDEFNIDFSIDDTEEDNPGLIRESIIGVGVRCTGIDLEQGTVDIQPIITDEFIKPPSRGYLFISISGDRVRLNRRSDAWQRIRQSNNPIPGLGLLLENSDRFVPRGYLAKKVKSKDLRRHFGGTPTQKQALAIETALNTPDIALIQGPPGTGKTRVITTISNYLSSVSGTQGFLPGQILLTSYQHDAVENLAIRSNVFDLPIPKIGSRRTHTETFDPIRAWNSRLLEELKDK